MARTNRIHMFYLRIKPGSAWALMWLLFLPLWGIGQSPELLDQPVNTTFASVPLSDALKTIETHSPLRFSFNPDELPPRYRTSNQDPNTPIKSLLQEWKKDTGLGYRVLGQQIALYQVVKGTGYRAPKPNIPNYTVSGYVVDEATGERLPYAKVYDLRSGRGAITNAYGFYSLSLEKDSVELVASFPDYLTQPARFFLQSSKQISLHMKSYVDVETVDIIAAQSGIDPQEADMSTQTLSLKEIKRLPTLLGEVDPVRTIQLLPGVQRGSEGSTGIFVRGGTPDQNLVLLDGIPLYYINHWGGYASVFNADALQDVRIIKGGFPARYGGRLSSVLEVTMKEGNRKETQVSGSLGLLSAKISVQGPIGKQQGREGAKTSYIISARRNYFDLVNRLISGASGSELSQSPLSYGFYDLNLKVNHILSENDRIYVSGYHGRDRSQIRENSTRWILADGSTNIGQAPEDFALQIDTRDNTRINWGNSLAAVRWNHVWGPKAFSNLSLSYSEYRYENTAEQFEMRAEPSLPLDSTQSSISFFSGIADLTLRWEMDYAPTYRHLFRWGAQAVHHTFRPAIARNQLIFQEDTLENTVEGNFQSIGLEGFAFVEHDWKVNNQIRIHSGLHAAAYRYNQRTYTSLQPRINIRWLLQDRLSLKASYAQMNQFLHLLVNNSVGIPVDLWVPATDSVPPQQSQQWAVGFAWQSRDGMWEASLEGYYKRMTQLIDYQDGASMIEAPTNGWEALIEQDGTGEAYGGELFIRKKKGKLTGWLAYTLAWNWRQFDQINFGRRYRFRYDRRHSINLVGMYALRPGIDLSANWVFNTGELITLATGRHESYYQDRNSFPRPDEGSTDVDGAIYLYEGGRNNIEMRAYHRLDVGISFTKAKKWGQRTWRFGLYNAYNRLNPFYYDYALVSDDDNNPGKARTALLQYTLFPINPSVSYSFEF